MTNKEIELIKTKAWLVMNAGTAYGFTIEAIALRFTDDAIDLFGYRVPKGKALKLIEEADAELRGEVPKHVFYGSLLIR